MNGRKEKILAELDRHAQAPLTSIEREIERLERTGQ
jgi:hypothetical protein